MSIPAQQTAAVLLRVSTKKQAEEGQGSYEVQLRDCLSYAAAHGFTVPDDLIWQEVGKRDQYHTRDGLQQALEAAEQGRYQALIVWRLDRLTDEYNNFTKIMETLGEHGACVWSATEPDVDVRTEQGMWYAHTKLHFQVKPERRTTALRTQQNRRFYTEQGRPWASNIPRYGYRWVVDWSRTRKVGDVQVPLKERLEPHPATAPVVVLIYQWADDGWTLGRIAKELSGHGDPANQRPTPYQHAGAKGGGTGRAQGVWSLGVLRKILGFHGYMGRWPAYTTRYEPIKGTEKHRQRALPEAEWVWVEPSPAPALVTPAQWQRVQARLAANKLYAPRNTKAPIGPERALLARGMARCGTCGAAMDAHPRGYRNQDGTTPDAYHCRRGHAVRRSRYLDTPCANNDEYDARGLDRGVWEAFVHVLRDPSVLARYAQRQWLADHPEEAGVQMVTPLDEAHDAAARCAKLDERIARLMAQIADPRIDPDNIPLYDQQLSMLRAQRTAAEHDRLRATQVAETFQRHETTLAT